MLDVINICKSYAGKPLLKGISFSIAEGETICLLGSSGSGKSTILRIIAGLELAESGDVCWDGKSLKNVPVHERGFGLMFQDYALFPHLDVFGNVAFGLRMQKLPPEKIRSRVIEVLRQTNLAEFSHRSVTDLSGGEQQRVALARALAPWPRLLMLDEPLGALDRALRESLIDELRNILRSSGVPAVYVTHDQQEAFTIADRIILLHDGAIAQMGSAPQVFKNPASSWTASFLGLGNLLEGVIHPDGVKTSLGTFYCETRRNPGETVTLLLRPKAELVEAGETLTGKVTDVVFRGQDFRVQLESGMYFFLNRAPVLGEVVRLKVEKLEIL